MERGMTATGEDVRREMPLLFDNMKTVQQSANSWCHFASQNIQLAKSTSLQIAELLDDTIKQQERYKDLQVKFCQSKQEKEKNNDKWSRFSEELKVTRSKVQELKSVIDVLEHRIRDRQRIVPDQHKALSELGENINANSRLRKDAEETIVWYNRMFGLRIEVGSGIKFVFINIDQACPEHEFSVTIRRSRKNNRYKCTTVFNVLKSSPCIGGLEELLAGLNKTDDLFTFLRDVRKGFRVFSNMETSSFEFSQCSSLDR